MVLSPNVCYVCGGGGGVQTVRMRAFEKAPYFPFLESHEPPKGAVPPTKDGAVDCCNICYMFLNQQWDSYEKSRTPIIKRLYWLKRVDNRPFTGAEMRMQGEYAAHMMGLQCYPSNTGTMSPYDYSPVDNTTASKSGNKKTDAKTGGGSRSKTDNTANISHTSSQNTSHINESMSEIAEDTTVSTNALDLSTSRDESDLRDRSIDFGENKRDRSIDYVEKRDRSMNTTRERSSSTDLFSCYTCAAEHSVNTSRLIYDQPTKESEPFFPFLATLKKSSNMPDERSNCYRVCRSCYGTLVDQWKYYTIKQVPHHQRVYNLARDSLRGKIGSFSTGGSSPRPDVSSPVQNNVCYLCGQSYSRNNMKMLHTRAPLVKNSKHSIYFPFVSELRRPENAQPIDQYGRVVSCRACYSYLQRQWQGYQQDNVAVEDRRFVLRPLTDPDTSHASYASSPSPGKSQSSSYLDDSTRSEIDTSVKDMNPLNIQIGDSSKEAKNLMQGLLAIAPHASPSAPAPVASATAPPLMLPMGYPGYLFGAWTAAAAAGAAQSAGGAHHPGSLVHPGATLTAMQELIKREVERDDDEDDNAETRAEPRYRRNEDTRKRRETISVTNDPPIRIKTEDLTSNDLWMDQSGDADMNQSRELDQSELPDLNQSTDREEEIDVGESNVKDYFQDDERKGEGEGHVGDGEVKDGEVSMETEDAKTGMPPGGKSASQTSLNGLTNRSTATVPPMTSSGNAPPLSPARQLQQQQSSGFAAALRKLAKQAEGPADSPATSDQTQSSSHTAKQRLHKPPPLGSVLGGSGSGGGGGEAISAPPVVTIAPTVSKQTYLSSERQDRNGADRANSVMLDPLGIKPERDKMTPSSHERAAREDDRPRSKDSSSVAARLTPHNSFPTVSSTGSHNEDSLATSRGFQPYRPGDTPAPPDPAATLRHASLPGLASLDAYTAYLAQAQAAQAAAYPGAYGSGHPGIRMDDPLLLERYRLMQSSAIAASAYPYAHPAAAGLMSHPALSPYLDPRARYPADIMAQMGYAAAYLGHPSAKLPELSPGSAERLKEEEQRRLQEREREEREVREKERERQREKEEKERIERERAERERAEKEAVAVQRQKAETERARLAAAGGSIYSAERLLATSGLYAQPPPSTHGSVVSGSVSGSAHEGPLNLKRYDDVTGDAASRHLHLNGDARAVEESRAQLAAAHSYRTALEAKSRALSAAYAPPPLSVPKPPSSSNTTNPHEPPSHSAPAFHRPFEAANGYDRAIEYERLINKEREKMVNEHRLAQEKAAQKAGYDSRGNVAAPGSRTHERLASGGSDARSDVNTHSGSKTVAPTGNERLLASNPPLDPHLQYSHRLASETMKAHYGNNSSLNSSSSTTHSSQSARRSLMPPSKSATSNMSSSHSGQHSSALNYSHTDRHSTSKAPMDLKSPPPHLKQQSPLHGVPASHQSALSSLQNFSQSSPAITSLSNMINSENLLAGYGLDTKVQLHSKDMAKVQLHSNKDMSTHHHSRHNGVHTSSRMRLQPPEVGDNKNRQRLNSGDSHLSASMSMSQHRPKASPKRPAKQPNLGSHKPAFKRDSSYEPPAKRAHLSSTTRSDVEHTSRDYSARPITADELNRTPDYPHKAQFFYMLGLESVPVEKRKENEFMQRVCEWDADRREKARLFPPPPCTADTISKPYEYSTARLSQFIAAYSSPLKRKHSPSLSSSPTSQQPPHTLHQSTAASRSHDPALSQSAPVITTSQATPLATSSGVSQSVSAQFVQQFHESVLEQTMQQQMNKSTASSSQPHSAEVRYSLISAAENNSKTSSSSHDKPAAKSEALTHTSQLPSSLQSMQQMTSQLVPGSAATHKPMTSAQHAAHFSATSRTSGSSYVAGSSDHSGDQQSDTSGSGDFRWPGMEAVIEAYHKHLNECQTEKQILREQNSVLEQQHRALSRQAEQLSKRMEELLQNKQKVEEERKKHQGTLDALRRGLTALR